MAPSSDEIQGEINETRARIDQDIDALQQKIRRSTDLSSYADNHLLPLVGGALRQGGSPHHQRPRRCRSCGTLLADLDVHPRVAMQILRHADFSITMEVYAQVSSKQTRDALKRLAEFL